MITVEYIEIELEEPKEKQVFPDYYLVSDIRNDLNYDYLDKDFAKQIIKQVSSICWIKDLISKTTYLDIFDSNDYIIIRQLIDMFPSINNELIEIV